MINKAPPDVQAGGAVASAIAWLTKNPKWIGRSGEAGIVLLLIGALENDFRDWSEQLDDKADDIESDP